MGTINLTKDQVLSYSATFEPYGVGFARLSVKIGDRSVFATSDSLGSTDTSATFSIDASSFSQSFANCGSCEWNGSGEYTIVLQGDGTFNLKPSEVIETGTVTFTGPLPCSACGGEDPPADDPPPGGGGTGGGPNDDPYGGGQSDAIVPPPSPPTGDPCLPTVYVAPTPPVPTPCSDAASPGGTAGFS